MHWATPFHQDFPDGCREYRGRAPWMSAEKMMPTIREAACPFPRTAEQQAAQEIWWKLPFVSCRRWVTQSSNSKLVCRIDLLPRHFAVPKFHFCSIQSTSPNRVHAPIRPILTVKGCARIAPNHKSKKSSNQSE